MIADFKLGIRSTLYDEEVRERRKVAFKTALLYGSLLLNAILAIRLAGCRMGVTP